MAHQLRIYRGPHEESEVQHSSHGQSGPAISHRKVTVNVRDVLPLLADAVASQRTWLEDFEDDEITVSADLYEVLLAYQHYRRPSA